MVVPKDLKFPPLEQHQKRGFCKYHNFLGHNTSRCSLFRDLVQKGLNEGRLKFGNKPKPQMQVDSDPLKDVSIIYTDIAGCNMVEATIDVVEDLSVEAKVGTETDVAECRMVDIIKDAERIEETAPYPQFNEKMCRWVMMSFGVKNDGATYQKVKEVITSDQNAWIKITIYLAEIKSRKP